MPTIPQQAPRRAPVALSFAAPAKFLLIAIQINPSDNRFRPLTAPNIPVVATDRPGRLRMSTRLRPSELQAAGKEHLV